MFSQLLLVGMLAALCAAAPTAIQAGSNSLCAAERKEVNRSSKDKAKGPLEQDLADKRAGHVLDHFKLQLKDLDMVDEPPGKLQAIRFTRIKDSKKVRVTIWLEYTPKLFSAERRWKIEVIRAATVRRITTKAVK
jgi:hypothetical protein